MAREFETSALLLRAVNYGEADRICTFLSADRGKLPTIAKHSRGSKKRFRGGLGHFSVLRLSVRDSDASLLMLLDSEVVESFTEIGSDLSKMAVGTYALELVDLALHDGQGAEIYPTVTRFFRWLKTEHRGAGFVETGVHRLSLTLLSELGVLPDLDVCARTGAELVGDSTWIPDVGVVARAARHAGERGIELDPGARAYLRSVVAGRFPDRDDADARRGARSALHSVWCHTCGREPKSYAFMVEVLDA